MGLYDDLPPPKNASSGSTFSILSDLPPPTNSSIAGVQIDPEIRAAADSVARASATPKAGSVAKFVPASLLKKANATSSHTNSVSSATATAVPSQPSRLQNAHKSNTQLSSTTHHSALTPFSTEKPTRSASDDTDRHMLEEVVSDEDDDDDMETDMVAEFLTITRDIDDVYDPARPNDYDEYIEEKVALNELKRQEKQRQELEKKMLEDLMRSSSSGSGQPAKALSGDEVFKRRQMMSQGGGNSGGDGNKDESSAGAKSGAKESIAQKMMMKMGWKEGQGLGKQEQGITNALVAKKGPGKSAVILPENIASSKNDGPVEQVGISRSGSIIYGPISRVVVLKNMVGPGEVDDELKDETVEECAKYGEIKSCHIYESDEIGVTPEEAVRIFLQFASQDSALKALVDLDGRFFGGRRVSGSFYAEWRFNSRHFTA
eukprot:TRINITY_DN8456_c0_g1_i1.p1 TRINITY_DN8456_c0_g1~~TRINITY_DN8456_c0_g1_i1.p1  ORF type:complete len:432 (+),score=121.21 TRINITY_DN8456_c0_g1_i1:66-1361(+)